MRPLLAAMKSPLLASTMLLALLLAALPARASDFSDSVREAAGRVFDEPSRVPGTEGHARSRAALEAELRAIPGVTVWADEYQLVVPVTLESRLEIDGASHDVHPMWPALSRLCTTPPGGIEAQLVYIGEGRHSEIPPRSMRGAIAVMEYTGGTAWTNPAAHGAAAIILLGSPGMSVMHAHAHVMYHPVDMPRFFVPGGELADRLRAGAGRGRLVARAEWQEVTARNLLAYFPGTDPGADRRALGLLVQADAMGMTPDAAPGADAAVDAAFALETLRGFSQEPPRRNVLVAFVDGFGIFHRGTRELLATIAVRPQERESFLRDERRRLADYEAMDAMARGLQQRGDALEVLHLDEFSGLQQIVKDAVNTRLAEIDTQLEPRRVELFLAEGDEAERLRGEVEALSLERQQLIATLRQLLTTREITDESRGRAEAMWARVLDRVARQAEDQRRLVAREAGRDALRASVLETMGLPDDSARPIGFLLGVDLSDSGEMAGPQLDGRMLRLREIPNTREMSEWLRRVDAEERDQLWPGAMGRAVNLRPVTTTDDFEAYQMGQVAAVTAPATVFGVPAMTWATLSAFRVKVDTPNDRLDLLDWSRLGPQLDATRALARRLADRDDFPWPEPRLLSRWMRFTGDIVDQAPGEPLARLPMGGYLTCLVVGEAGGGRATPNIYWGDTAGMRRVEHSFTMTDGRFTRDYWPGYLFNNTDWAFRTHYVQAFDFDEAGRIVRAVDLQRSGRGVTLGLDALASNPTPMRARVFTCQEQNYFGLLEPRYLNPVGGARVIDARRDSPPRRMNSALSNGTLNLLLEPKSRVQVLGTTGTDNRIALLNIDEESAGDSESLREAMRGFQIGEPLPSHPWHTSAVDFYRLNGLRLASFRSAGITSKPIDELRERTTMLLERADAAWEADDGDAFFEAASGALANELRAYRAVRETANDVARGAIFLLLMLVPFSWAMERLLVATPHVYRQIGSSMGIFAAMAGVLWAFHPAFRISGQPMIVVLAFVIILMSLVVMTMVFSRFERELEELRSGRAESAGARSSGAGLAFTALKLGIANMRKRKLRTALTATTVVLITFTLLCFTSTSAYTGQKDNVIDREAEFTGVIVRQPSVRRIQEGVVEYVRELVPDQSRVAIRGWWFSPWSGQWRLHARNPETGVQASLPAALGLTGQEAGVSRVKELLPRWEDFAAGKGVYLSRTTAGQLGVEPGDRVVIAGRELELLGAFDHQQFDKLIVDLDQEPLRPFDYHQLGYQERLELISGDWSTELLASEIESGAGLEPLRKIPQTSSEELAIVPFPFVEGAMGDPMSVRSIAIRTDTPEEARALAQELVNRLAIPITYGEPDGVHIVASTPLLPQPPKSLVIPLAIAGLIVFNTMLSSIAERKKEIYIYTSLGLAPLHIAMLFLAEAITYGLMGSVFGYVMGQWLATGLGSLGLLGGITLNYSGTQAIFTMTLVLLVIVVAALVPAFLAGRLAAPSNRMKWDVPAPDGDVIRDVLPFTVTPSTAGALLTYLHDYMLAHKEGAVGDFTTDRVELCRDGEQPELRGAVWLAPYDLGVRQEFRLHTTPTEDAEVLGLEIELVRGSGPTGSWRKLNRVHLSALRRQLLGWRKQKPERVLAYILAAREGRVGVS